MLAMQYRFTLPADYDMSVVERRICDKGPLLDGFPGLAFKAYLVARRAVDGPENRYAPFYLWNASEGAADFLTGAGFANVAQSFGWPQVKTWIVARAASSPDIGQAAFASREATPIPAHAALAAWRVQAREEAERDVENGALAAVAGFDPTGWTALSFRLWRERPAATAGELYRVGYVAWGGPR